MTDLTAIARAAAKTAFDMAGVGANPLAETVTLRSKADPAVAEVSATAVVSRLSAFEQIAMQGVTERLLFQVSELGSFTVNGATLIQRSGEPQRGIEDDDVQTVAGAVVIVNWRSGG